MKKLLVSVIVCLTALTLSTMADTNESWMMTLGGVGNTSITGDAGTSAGVDLSIGRTGHLLLPLELGIRQGVTYDGNSTTIGTTKVYADWTLFTIGKKFDVFAGGNIGMTYGNTTPLWTAAPEVGARWWIKQDVAIFGRAETPFDLTNGRYSETVRYFLGFLVKL